MPNLPCWLQAIFDAILLALDRSGMPWQAAAKVAAGVVIGLLLAWMAATERERDD